MSRQQFCEAFSMHNSGARPHCPCNCAACILCGCRCNRQAAAHADMPTLEGEYGWSECFLLERKERKENYVGSVTLPTFINEMEARRRKCRTFPPPECVLLDCNRKMAAAFCTAPRASCAPNFMLLCLEEALMMHLHSVRRAVVLLTVYKVPLYY